MTDFVDLDSISKAGMGVFLSAVADDSLRDYDPEEAFDVIDMATASPVAASGLPGANGAPLDMGAMREAMALEYYSAVGASMCGSLLDDLDAKEKAETAGTESVAFSYAGLGPEDIADIETDELTGDSAVRTAAMARLYLG